ncbi:isopentenyl-diphosphate Delta-isomerase [Nitratireductor sp. GCM10026969]|uniref:isopentenyl-diphosphate Delta-isomerase n=1 Tax=Nitratireductor sp. GCM10026969 TaxID=3252645 RepID=UPI00360EA129
MSHEEQVILVSPDDRAVGVAGKLEAHRRGLRHRAFSVILFNGEGEMLIQKRAAEKYHSAGQWANACCSHPRPGEAVDVAVVRRLRWELGIDCPVMPLQTVSYCARVSSELVENEIAHLFVGRHDGTLRPNPEEVAEARWIDPDRLMREVAAAPERFTVWFRIYLERCAPSFAAAARKLSVSSHRAPVAPQ